MTAAFNWSPGGCCCPTPAGWFNNWFYTETAPYPRSGGAFVRSCSLVPSGRDVLFNSREGVDWYVDAGFQIRHYSGYVGFPAGNALVWVEFLKDGDSSFYFGLLDSASRQLLWHFNSSGNDDNAHIRNVLPGGVDSTYHGFHGVSATGVGGRTFTYPGGVPALVSVDPTGAVTLTSAPKGLEHHAPTETGSNITVRRAEFVAKRNWPRGAASRTTYATVSRSIGGAFSYFGPTASSLYRGSVSVVDGAIQVSEDDGVFSVPTGSAVAWVFYDESPTHWVGVARERTNIFNPNTEDNLIKYHLLIDGQTIATREDWGFYPVNPGIDVFWAVPHVCHPHAALGDGWIGVPTRMFATLPTQANPGGFLEDPQYPWRIIFYRAGAEAWRSGRSANSEISPNGPRVVASGDHWLYLDSYSSTPQPPMDGLRILHAKHDGSQQFIPGTFHTDGTVSASNTHFPPHNRVVQNSGLIGSMPENFPDDFLALPV